MRGVVIVLCLVACDADVTTTKALSEYGEGIGTLGVDGAAGTTDHAQVSFVRESTGVGCGTRVETAGCRTSACYLVGAPDEVPEQVDAGDVVYSTPSEQHIIRLGTWDYDRLSDEELFMVGDDISFVVAGDREVPPFELTVVAPPPVSLTTPAASHRVSEPFELAFDPQPGSVDIFFRSLDETMGATIVTYCDVDGGDAAALISPDHLAEHVAADATLRVIARDRTTTSVGDWTITATVTSGVETEHTVALEP